MNAYKPWVATSRQGFIARSETRNEAIEAVRNKSQFGEAFVKNEVSGEVWVRQFKGGAWEWDQKKPPSTPDLPGVG
jgi:hypothetical protein